MTKTEENDKLAADFETLLIKELQKRGVHFTKATAHNFANVNIDVHIYIEDYWMRDLFKYIGLGRLHRDYLRAGVSLETYVKGYVDRELEDLQREIDYALSGKSWSVSAEQQESARKIKSWLGDNNG